MWQTVLPWHKQVRRQLIDLNIGTNKKIIQPYTRVDGNNNKVFLPLGESSAELNSDGLKSVNTILKDGTDLIGAPARLINSIQQNWLIFLILIVIILLFILIFYCIIRYHCSSIGKIFTKRSSVGKSATITKAKKKTPLLSFPLLSENHSDLV